MLEFCKLIFANDGGSAAFYSAAQTEPVAYDDLAADFLTFHDPEPFLQEALSEDKNAGFRSVGLLPY